MKKSISLILAFSIFFGVLTVVPVKAEAQISAPVATVIAGYYCLKYNGIGGCILYGMQMFLAWAVSIVLAFVSLLTNVAGYLLNGVFYHTIVNISDNYRQLAPLKTTWGVIRDIANMTFIFVLLYAGIKTILGQEKNSQEVIKNVIIAAVLMNFSLFLTGIVIDISNALSVTLYDAIAPGVASKGFDLGQAGLSNAFMEHLRVQSLFKAVGGVSINGIITTGIMGTIMLVITSFSFFAVAIMFIIRYVVLLLVMILSPIYFVSLALPKGTDMDGYKKQWLDALIGQAFFAPIYLLITWIAVQVMGGIFTVLSSASKVDPKGISASSSISSLSASGILSSGGFVMFMNFAIVIVLIISSLVVAKKWADKAGGGMGKLTSWATGAAGGATMGMAARLGRSTIGAGASRAAQSESFQRFAGRSVAGQFALNQTRKAAGASFDFRASRAGDITLKDAGAGQAKTGGFEDTLKTKMEKRDKFAQALRSDPAKQAYASRIARGPLTVGGSRSSGNTVFGTLGRHNRVAASKILDAQIQPWIAQRDTVQNNLQNLQNRDSQLNQQLNSAQAALNNLPTTAPATQRSALTTQITNLNNQITTNQTNITNTTNQLAFINSPNSPLGRLQAQINNLQLNNPRNQTQLTPQQQAQNAAAVAAGNPPPNTTRARRADEQNY